MGIKTLYKPEVFQGNMRKKDYFEGYFFKLVDEKEKETVVIIPGISLEDEDTHAFIQILREKTGKSYYFRYPIKEFSYDKETLFLQIGDNLFTQSYVRLNIHEDNLDICGIVWFDNLQPVDNKLLRPGVMGPFRFIPFMECYHGVVSMNHHLKGTFVIDHKAVRFTGGKGYIEKDWGNNFPNAYLWAQSNHFIDPNLSFMLSIAQIPLWKRYFTGFIVCISTANKTRVLATYTGAKIKKFIIEEDEIFIEIKNRRERIEINLSNSQGKQLIAPQKGAMKRTVYENLSSNMEIKIFYKNKLMTHQYTTVAATELSGEVHLMTKE
ncbi:MAG: tocopherol cyclase family protein [Cellulosilyticaceae bacterium]